MRVLVDETQERLFDIKRRWYVLRAFEQELVKRTRNKSFHVHSVVLWDMVVDHHCMLVIDLASWARGLCGRQGLLNQIKARCNELPPPRRPTSDEASDCVELARAERRERAFKTLFENCVNKKNTRCA
ncbi:MAG: hypothetical protein D6689_00005 [Deltaproteobacteria bacterium]|nr:MAG: hypothetical protein D6689_00005 [Deltaproteobacteria bacterium]